MGYIYMYMYVYIYIYIYIYVILFGWSDETFCVRFIGKSVCICKLANTHAHTFTHIHSVRDLSIYCIGSLVYLTWKTYVCVHAHTNVHTYTRTYHAYTCLTQDTSCCVHRHIDTHTRTNIHVHTYPRTYIHARV